MWMSDLTVLLYGREVGKLKGSDWRNFTFVATPSVFERFSVGSNVLSESVPLDVVPNRGGVKRMRNFFAELLPEGRILSSMAQLAGILEYDTIGFLSAYGRDIAGAIEIFDPSLPREPKTPFITKVNKKQIRTLLEDTVNAPLANAPSTGKTSLGGVQSKIVLARVHGGWHQVHDGYPSTHIIKPVVPEYPTMIFDELFGAELASNLGLNEYKQWIEVFDGLPALVIERYDRVVDPAGGHRRIHQEDFNQILGARGNQKYQEYGGKVTLKRVASVFNNKGDTESLQRLAKQLILAVAMGDLDMHTKNIGMLHFEDETSTLTPAYDMVPLCHQNTDGKMALAVAGEYYHAALTSEMITNEISSWGLAESSTIVANTLEEIRDAAEGITIAPQAYQKVKNDVINFTENLLMGKAVGKSLGERNYEN
jgi:serine/threonine-protein kinase HipA